MNAFPPPIDGNESQGIPLSVTSFIPPTSVGAPVKYPLTVVTVCDAVGRAWSLVFDSDSGHGSLHAHRVWLVRRGLILGDPPIMPATYDELAAFFKNASGRTLQKPPTIQFYERHHQEISE